MPRKKSPPRRPPASDPKTAHEREFNTKRRGELSELAFAHKAASLGFGVAKPYGDSERFDFILISRDWPEGDKLWCVQVKSTATLVKDFYCINARRHLGRGLVAYKATEVDFLVAHIIPDDSWFIFPIQDVPVTPSFRPKRSRRRGIHEPYREAWHLLRPPK